MRFPGFEGEWEECCNEDFGKVITGNTPPTAETRFYENGHKLWASPADLGGDKYISSTQTKLTEQGFSKTRIVPSGATLVTCIGSTIGKMGMASQEMSTNQQINTVIPNESTDRQYLYYAIQSQFPRYVKSIAVQAVPIISKGSFEKLKNYRPHIEEQKKIGSFLDLLDCRISIQNKVIERYESLIKAINKRHFKSIREDIYLSSIKLSVILSERKEYCENDGTYPHASLSKEGVDRKSERYDRDFLVRDKEKKYKVTRLNDICYNPANLKFGVITRNKIGPMVFSPIYVTFEIATNYSPEYIECYLTNPDFVRYMLKYEQGTVYERMAVSPEDFLSVRIKVPSLQVQHKHAAIISSINRCLSTERKITDGLLQLKQGILKQMFI